MTLYEKGKKIYKRLKAKLEKTNKGKIIAIEPNSGNYIVGKDEFIVALKAQQKFPGKIFDFFRIGYPAVHKFR
jgi:hypothetical protein